MADGIDTLNSFETRTLLRWFFNYLPMEQRRQLMRELPLLYNKAVGQEAMMVINHSDLMRSYGRVCIKCHEPMATDDPMPHLCESCIEAEVESLATPIDPDNWTCPVCDSMALASHEYEGIDYHFCEECNAWYKVSFETVPLRITSEEIEGEPPGYENDLVARSDAEGSNLHTAEEIAAIEGYELTERTLRLIAGGSVKAERRRMLKILDEAMEDDGDGECCSRAIEKIVRRVKSTGVDQAGTERAQKVEKGRCLGCGDPKHDGECSHSTLTLGTRSVKTPGTHTKAIDRP